ncbi:TetR/AcrR family transcriptional regulator [Enteractinococcus helveticum]|uniref:TetR family transcriptional regulator n=1 Tax=Enteractinococcus helveticum TaxID=1837282 RepID=A0A1B7LY53_9MICC|nr:TetR/AcrR family transcriptional regulator [Enteractinococcus helveticum]OAV60229.1 TetR family transcriptional regulator [Enteractinococcus helveticum]
MTSDDRSHPQPPETDRVLHLLWRHELGTQKGARGPRKKRSLDEIIAAAIETANHEDLEQFSMRKVADRLGMSVMSLYTYVPGRSELIALMVDEVIGRTGLPQLQGSLRDRLRTISQLLWDEYHRYPWLLAAQSHRPWIGPNISARYEWELEALEDAGLDDISMDHAVALIESHTAASASNGILASKLIASSGISDVEWWNNNAPVLEEVMPAGRFPISSRVGSAVGNHYQSITSHEAVYRFGLEIILDGLEAHVSSKDPKSAE